MEGENIRALPTSHTQTLDLFECNPFVQRTTSPLFLRYGK